MKQGSFNTILLLVAFSVGFSIHYLVFGAAPEKTLLHDLFQGGPLIAVLMAMSILVVTYIVERSLSIKKAQGTGDTTVFLKSVVKNVTENNFAEAVKVCDKQRGSMANILKSGISRYLELSGTNGVEKKEKISEVKRVFEETTMLEMPVLEKNLVSLSTIASIATMVGLLGTVIGMIRSFAALAKAGSADAVGLSRGISEALFNTAGGIGLAIVGIVAYNFFTTKIDGITYVIDEATKDLLDNLNSKN
ncbi:MAG: MotA/TolQ/ExbB proton channel family protein [Bacteroidetes bacterium]|nr:MotA/TolQ/ExbB proton channel family protein [Bacteroidota bacterium]